MKLKNLVPTTIAISSFFLFISLADSAQALDCGWQQSLSAFLGKNPQGDRQAHFGPLSDVEEINKIYIEVLGRQADFQGLVTWTKELDRYRTLCQIRREVAYSREASEAINQIYREVLDREVDSKGLELWQNVLAKGASLAELRRYLEKYREEMEKKFRQNQL